MPEKILKFVRYQAFQWTNQPWMPKFLRKCADEYLDFLVGFMGINRPFLPLFQELFNLTKPNTVVVLNGMTGGGPAFMASELRSMRGGHLTMTLSDDHLDKARALQIGELSGETLDSISSLATTVQGPAVAVAINSFHRLSNEKAILTLKEVSEKFDGVLIAEGNNRSPRQVFGMLIAVPALVFATAFFVPPFSIKRLLFTYLIPLIPLVVVWDGIAALFRIFPPEDLLMLAEQAGRSDYEWKSAKVPNHRGGFYIYLMGYRKIK